MVGHGREPVQVGEHLLDVPHDRFEPLGDVELGARPGLQRQRARHFLDHLVARVADGVDRVAEADHHFLVGDPAADVGLGLVGVRVALLDFQRDLVGAAVLGPAQRADGRGDGRVHVRSGAGHHPRGEGGSVELVFGVQDQRGVHRLDPVVGRGAPVQQVQEMAADRVVVGLHVDALAVVAEVVPVQQHRAERGHQAVGDGARAGDVVVVLFRHHAAEGGHAGAHHIHRMAGRGQRLERRLDRLRQPAHRLQARLVGRQLGQVGQFAVHQQVGDLLELAAVGHVQDIVAAVV